MATKRQLEVAARKVGATIHYEQGLGLFTVEAPAGHVWTCDGSIHELVQDAEWDLDDPRGHRNADDAIERMSMGVVPCPTPDCEWCADVRAGIGEGRPSAGLREAGETV